MKFIVDEMPARVYENTAVVNARLPARFSAGQDSRAFIPGKTGNGE
jgi:hypothetical protein